MEELQAVISGNKLEAIFRFNLPTSYQSIESKKYTISSCLVFSLKVITISPNINYDSSTCYTYIFVRFVSLIPEDELNYTIKFTSKKLKIANKCFTTDDGTWRLIREKRYERTGTLSLDVTVTMDIVPCASSFATLHDDTELTDFELRGEDGSVHIHRAVLAASSPVLRRMLGGTWRETTEGRVDVPGTSKTTLQHLKDYVYLRTLPETGLEQLLLLASCYMMPDLEQRCINKLVLSLTAQNACDMLKFAVKNEMTKLMLAILNCVQKGNVKVNEMYDFLQIEYLDV